MSSRHRSKRHAPPRPVLLLVALLLSIVVPPLPIPWGGTACAPTGQPFIYVAALNVRVNAGAVMCVREVVSVATDAFFNFHVTAGGDRDVDVHVTSVDGVAAADIPKVVAVLTEIEVSPPGQGHGDGALALPGGHRVTEVESWARVQQGEHRLEAAVDPSLLFSYLQEQRRQEAMAADQAVPDAAPRQGTSTSADRELDPLAQIRQGLKKDVEAALDSEGNLRKRIVTACFDNSASYFTPKWVNFELRGERVAHEWIQKETLRYIDPIELRISHLTGDVERMYSKVTRVRRLQKDHRSTIEDANDRLWIWSLFQVVSLVTMGFLQIHFLKRFLERRTLV